MEYHLNFKQYHHVKKIYVFKLYGNLELNNHSFLIDFFLKKNICSFKMSFYENVYILEDIGWYKCWNYHKKEKQQKVKEIFNIVIIKIQKKRCNRFGCL